MVLIWDLHGLDRISMGFLSSYTAMRLWEGDCCFIGHIKDYRGCAATRGDSHPARGHTTYIGCSQRSHSETPESESLIGWALRSQQFICSESLEEVGEVPGAAKVPQHLVEEADCVQPIAIIWQIEMMIFELQQPPGGGRGGGREGLKYLDLLFKWIDHV